MSAVATIKDGQVVTTASQESLSKSPITSSKDMNEETFLKLLVAEMQYQDPLEPSSNTDYVAQFAQFSQVESINTMASSMELTRASSLVGQEVYIKTSDSSGNAKYIQGKVDYVAYQNKEAYLSIGGELYSLADLDTVVDVDYQKATDKAESFINDLSKLPPVANITDKGNGEAIDALANTYADMTDYEKNFIGVDVKKALAAYMTQLSALRGAAKETEETQAEGETKVEGETSQE